MKAMILAAGYGTRLKELTQEIPKPLVRVAGREMISFAIEHLKTLPLDLLVVNAHYFASKLKSYLESVNDLSIKVSEESLILGTGGGIANARHLLEDQDCFVVYNCDVYADFDLNKLVEHHKESKALATLAINQRDTSRPLFFNSSLELCGYQSSNGSSIYGEDLNPQAFGFTGIQVLSKRIFDYLKADIPFSTIPCFINASRDHNERIIGYDISDSYWLDLGTKERLAELENLLTQRYE